MRRGRRVMAAMVVGGLVLAACSRAESSSTDTVDAPTTVASTVPVPSAAPTTEPPPTTAVPATTVAPTTTVVPTTEPPATTAAPTTTSVDATETTSPSDAEPPAAAPANAFVTLEPALVEIDPATGAVVREVVDFFTGEGVFRGALRLDPGGRSLWFSEAYEDGWYGCESSVGNYGVVDLETGDIRILGPGGGAEPSPNGDFSVVVSSEVCVPDPQSPANWVLTPGDRAVVRELSSGDERAFITDPPPADYDSPSLVRWAGFSPAGNLLVMTLDGTVRNVDLNGSRVLQDHPVVLTDVGGVPVGATEDALLVLVTGDEGSVELLSISAETGDATLLASSERFFEAGLDAASGTVIVAGFAEIVVEPGAPVTVFTAPEDEFVGALDW